MSRYQQLPVSSGRGCAQWLCMVLAVLGMNLHAQERPATTFADDVFGYQIAASGSCPTQWVDSSAGQTLILQAAGTEIPANDDGGAELTLDWAFEFYGQLQQQLVVSSNGYVGFAADLLAENGGDYSNDCPLPAVPENNASALGRIAVWHDDLQGSAGSITVAQFDDCPRPGRLPGDACSVISWQNWGVLAGISAGLDFQLLLYRRARDVVMQYGSDLPDSSSVSIGIQHPALLTGVNLACNVTASVPDNSALCIEHPLAPDTLLSDGMEDRDLQRETDL